MADIKLQPKEVFECFRSRARINGDELLFDGRISARLKRQAVTRGFTESSGRLRRKLHFLERMVMRMRYANTGEAFNHEWWADWASAPDWYKNFEEVFLGNWLFYPAEDSNLQPQEVGEKIGYEFEYKRRKFERASADPEFIERWKLADFGPPEPPELPPELKDEKIVYHYCIGGYYTDWTQYAVDSLRKLTGLRRKIFQLSLKLGADNAAFAKGMAEGAERAQAVDLDEDLAGANERENILRIMECNFEVIAQLRNRREIADFIIARLPKGRREFLKNEAQYRAFIERLRHTYFSKIDLTPAARGMPRKSEKMTPRPSRILFYTPEISSGSETQPE